MDRKRILEMAVGVFLGNVAFLMFAWILFAVLSRMFGWDQFYQEFLYEMAFVCSFSSTPVLCVSCCAR